MLFFFELFLFVLVMLTLALGELVSRWLALILWLVVTAFALIGYLLAKVSLRSSVASEDAPPTALDVKWAQTLLYNWRRSNVLLVLGLAVVAAWYWLGR